MLLALAAAVVGASLMIGTYFTARHRRSRALDDLLGMLPVTLEQDGAEAEAQRLASRAADLAGRVAGQVIDQVDRSSSLGTALARAKIRLRPGEFMVITAGFGLGTAAALLAVTHVPALAVMGAGLPLALASVYVRRRIARRRRAFEVQLPDALSLIASSLSAGHTFLRAIQMMCEECAPPLSEEFSMVVAESRLGDPLVEALDRMAERLQIRDVDIVVQAIRIQQTVGGRLADLLHTLSDFIRSRDEVRREVRVLTAEGKMSAYVLTGLVPFLFVMIQVMNPNYIKPLFNGAGLFILAYSGVSVVIGLFVILKMVTIDF